MAKKNVDDIVEPISTEELVNAKEVVEPDDEITNFTASASTDSNEDTKVEANSEKVSIVHSDNIKAGPIQLERPRKVYARPNKRSNYVLTSVPMTFPGDRIGDFIKVEGKFRQIGQSYGWIYRPI